MWSIIYGRVLQRDVQSHHWMWIIIYGDCTTCDTVRRTLYTVHCTTYDTVRRAVTSLCRFLALCEHVMRRVVAEKWSDTHNVKKKKKEEEEEKVDLIVT